MARARNIKPGFFTNEILVELPFEVRLLFIGLWTIADRAGRLEDRPKRIKMAIFPADSVDVDAALDALQWAGFLVRYAHGGDRYIQILAFDKHQNPHKDEKQSIIPAPCEHGASTVQARSAHDGNRADSLIPDSLIPDSLIPDSLIPDSLIPDSLIPDSLKPPRQPRDADEGFAAFWDAYPRKVNKAGALKAWRKLAPSPDLVRDMLAAIERQKGGEQWQRDGGQFIPHPATWLNGQRWTDEIAPAVRAGPRESDLDRSRREAFEKLTGKINGTRHEHVIIDV